MSKLSQVVFRRQSKPRKSEGRYPRRPAGKSSTRSISVATGLAVVLIWEIVGRRINPIFSSYPSNIVQEMQDLFERGILVSATIDSLKPFLAGYFLAVAFGIPIGLLLGRFRLLEAAFGSYVIAAYTTPIIALIPLYALWFGLGFSVKVAIIFTMSVFPIVINTWDGARSVNRRLIEVGIIFVASESSIMRKIIMPATVPHMMTGLRLAVGRGIVAMVVAEFFTAVSGLGALIITAGNNFNTAGVFAPVVVLMALGVGLTQLVGALEKKVAPWQQSLSGRDTE